jgi:RimJ/RimL family protein N-acetyltransferase
LAAENQQAVDFVALSALDVRGVLTRLRPALPGEAKLVYSWAVDPEVVPFWGGADSYPDFESFMADWAPFYFDGSEPTRGRAFMIEALPEGRPIGVVATNEIDARHMTTEIDMLIGVGRYRGRGYGSDALGALVRFLFDEVGLHRIWLGTYDFNVRARRLYEKVGFVVEGVLRQSDWVDGRWVDVVVYGLLEGDRRG